MLRKRPPCSLRASSNQGTPRLSPDGRWIAYVSNETGRDEIYVQPLSGGGGKWQLSSGGGNHPRWQRDGRQLLYLEPPNKMMAVAVRPGSGFEASLPSRLFETRFSVSGGSPYDVSADGQKFLVNLLVEEPTVAPITIVLDWTAELAK